MKILAMSDIHGRRDVYRSIPQLVATRGIASVVLAGDLLGAVDGYDTIEDAQRADAEEILDILERVPVPILYIMGNDDMVELSPRSNRMQSLHGRRVELGAYNFVGYQYALPFMGGVFEKPEDEIAKDFMELEPLLDPRTVLVTHNPAFGLLDVGVLGLHAGSPTILAAVERRNVRAHVHGHIHECFGRVGRHFNVASGGMQRAMVLDLDRMTHTIVGEGP